MGKSIIMQDASFTTNAVYSYAVNSYTWGKGGINKPGESSGSTNATMSMIGLPLEYASSEVVLLASCGYKISAVLLADIASPTLAESTYTTYTTPIDSITIAAGKYFEVAVRRSDGENADLSDGPFALRIEQ